MFRIPVALTLALAALTGSPGLAQEALAPETGPEGGMVTCGAFRAMDSVGQLQALTTVQPLGDEIDTGDAEIARQWAADVSTACEGHPDRRLDDAAREALAE